MDTSPTSGGSNLGEVWQGCHRSLHLTGEHKVSALQTDTFSQGRSAFGCGCAGTPVARRVVLRISTAESNFSHQSKRKWIISPPDSPRWPGSLCLAEIVQLLQGEPWPLPLRRDLLSQVGRQIFHPHLERVNLWAWPVKG